MRSLLFGLLFVVAVTNNALAEDIVLKVTVDGINNGAVIPDDYAYCAVQGSNPSGDGRNMRPTVNWSKGPEGTQSYAIIMVDNDVPTDFTDASKEGKTISKEMKRQAFYHWIQVNIPSGINSVNAGIGRGSNKTQPTVGSTVYNDFTKFMAPERQSEFLGYDGPCPPWNDELMHHYHFIVHALKTDHLSVETTTKTADVVKMIEENSLAHGEVVGNYSLNSALEN